MSESRVSIVGTVTQAIPQAATQAAAVRRPGRKENTGGKQDVGVKPDGAGGFSPDDVKGLTEEVNNIMKSMHNEIRFKITQDSNELVVQVVDSKTNNIIRTIPPESLLNVRAKFEEVLGLIFDEER